MELLAVQDRLRTLCNTANVEDEFHFVCYCQIYNNLRTHLFDDAIHMVPTGL